jgi:riboflavin synthase
MFTGIVQALGEIVAIDKNGDWVATIIAGTLPLDKIPEGASISCNGICLTVIEKAKDRFKVQVSAETLSRTTALHWRPGMRLNLESALHAGDELGGHIVSGHIDGVAHLREKQPEGDSLRCIFEVPHEFAKFIAKKGSVALDGVSLTVNEVAGHRFGVNLIPYTLAHSTLGALKPGDEVNFEVDLMARYAERLLEQKAAS